MDKEQQMLFAYVVKMLHMLSVGQRTIVSAIDDLTKSMTQESIDLYKLGENNERYHAELERELGKLIGEDHKVLKLMRERIRY